MTVVSWNCNIAFRKKYEMLDQYQPDIAIIQECKDKILLPEYKEKMNYSDILLWEKIGIRSENNENHQEAVRLIHLLVQWP